MEKIKDANCKVSNDVDKLRCSPITIRAKDDKSLTCSEKKLNLTGCDDVA